MNYINHLTQLIQASWKSNSVQFIQHANHVVISNVLALESKPLRNDPLPVDSCPQWNVIGNEGKNRIQNKKKRPNRYFLMSRPAEWMSRVMEVIGPWQLIILRSPKILVNIGDRFHHPRWRFLSKSRIASTNCMNTVSLNWYLISLILIEIFTVSDENGLRYFSKF